MTVDEALLAKASGAAARVTELEDELYGAKADYRRTVRALHLAGASMREVAQALGISHQRVHQIIEGGGVRRWRRRRSKDAGSLRSCSFCGREQRQVRKLVAGPGVYICDPCILSAVGVSNSGRASNDAMLHPIPPKADLRCSFCGKDRASLKALVGGPASERKASPTICDECLGLCGEILSEELR